ncbi:MAG TPA: hypothetical protein VJ505_04445 [Holophagaceae bacterium]|nr:hypothetical protein [Holophagaceae bacterium]
MGICMGLTSLVGAQEADQAAWLQKARKAYYSLDRERMSLFKSEMVPNWRTLLAGQKMQPQDLTRVVDKLNGIHFTLVLNREGKASISHTTVEAENEHVAEGLKQIYGGMEQMATGFFQTWTMFMLRPPLPEPSTPFKLEELGGWYVLRYREGEVQIETTLGKDLVISSVKTLAPGFNSSLTPRFVKSPKGLVLVGYQATYRTPTGTDATDLDVGIANQEVGGLTFPGKLDLRGTYNGSSFQVEITFTGSQTKQD